MRTVPTVLVVCVAGEQALSKALVASRLCQAMADEAADDDLDVEIYEELSSFGKDFEDLCECLPHALFLPLKSPMFTVTTVTQLPNDTRTYD